MPFDRAQGRIAVFDLGGSWFRWGLYDRSSGLVLSRRAHAINYLSHPAWSAAQLQQAMLDFILQRVREMRCDGAGSFHSVSVALGAPINAHDQTVLGSGPLWGPSAKPCQLQARLQEALPELQWQVVNDVTALLAPYMDALSPFRKTLLITVSSGVGARLYDHRSGRIPYDPTHGVQGEIGHLTVAFELDGALIRRQCECGGCSHLNAFASGRGIARTLAELPDRAPRFGTLYPDGPDRWRRESDEYRLSAFTTQLALQSAAATELLEACTTPLSRTLAAALTMDPDIDRIVMTGGVPQGLGAAYRQALESTFLRDGLYQVTDHDPHYLTRRLHWQDPDDFAGLRGAGVYAAAAPHARTSHGK